MLMAQRLKILLPATAGPVPSDPAVL